MITINYSYDNSSYEYPSPVKLDSVLGNYFAIPASIILDTDINEKRAAIFSYLSTRRGIGCELSFSINNIVKWTGKKPDRHSNGVNDKTIQVIEYLEDIGYLTLYDKLDNASCIDAYFNLAKVSKTCEHERFAIIYIDELKHIMDCKDSNPDILLLVFAYLRTMIYRRKNKLMPEEVNVDNKNDHEYDIRLRRINSPDAYYCFYQDIADQLDISARAVSKTIETLSELGLIYYETLPRIQREGKWRTDPTIFCNTYKREGSYLLASGSDYYLTEANNKKKKILKTKTIKKGDS